ncbi:MAG: hypothetical protein ACNA7T_07355, partial [Haliea sp.]
MWHVAAVLYWRISIKKDIGKGASKKALINDQITSDPVRLIGADGEQVGIVSLREALAAAEGSQDMGALFVSMSVFVMAAALMMAGMMMRLALGRRASQTGLMLACGFKPAT